LFGSISKFPKQESLLGPKEVVLTFDDGPAPGTTRAVLDTLDQFCTKATFFEVGRMALAYPDLTKAVIARGHTVGAHTWSHPLALSRLKLDAAKDEIERGFTAVSLAAGQPVAPFFRFPGLGDTGPLLTHLQNRGIGTFTVDVVSDDSFVSDPSKLAKLTLQRVEAHQGGIILFHDIKPQTARALPVILTALMEAGYKVVHLRARHPLVPNETFTAELKPMLAKAELIRAKTGLFTAPRGDGEELAETPVTEVTPAPKSFNLAMKPGAAGAGTKQPKSDTVGSWTTSVKRPAAQ
jgi:peptidoglycan/xylan/chitin deacetylase (PgdA/CDA1 family)